MITPNTIKILDKLSDRLFIPPVNEVLKDLGVEITKVKFSPYELSQKESEDWDEDFTYTVKANINFNNSHKVLPSICYEICMCLFNTLDMSLGGQLFLLKVDFRLDSTNGYISRDFTFTNNIDAEKYSTTEALDNIRERLDRK